jgi:excisionase family DNA binding protein
MKHEMHLTPSPVQPPAPGKGDQEGTGTVSLSSSGASPGPLAGPQEKWREAKSHASQSGVADRDPLLTVEEFADELRVTQACVRRWILMRKVGVVKIGRLVRLRSSELRRVVDEGSRPRATSRLNPA